MKKKNAKWTGIAQLCTLKIRKAYKRANASTLHVGPYDCGVRPSAEYSGQSIKRRRLFDSLFTQPIQPSVEFKCQHGAAKKIPIKWFLKVKVGRIEIFLRVESE